MDMHIYILYMDIYFIKSYDGDAMVARLEI